MHQLCNRGSRNSGLFPKDYVIIDANEHLRAKVRLQQGCKKDWRQKKLYFESFGLSCVIIVCYEMTTWNKFDTFVSELSIE